MAASLEQEELLDNWRMLSVTAPAYTFPIKTENKYGTASLLNKICI